MMDSISEKLEHCVLCRSPKMKLVVPLAPMPIATPNFALSGELASNSLVLADLALDLWLCEACGHVQVSEVGNPEIQYRNYVYVTSLSAGLREHFARYCAEVIESLQPAPGSLVVELGSNDGTLLSNFKARGMRVLGVDPAVAIAEAATANGIETIPDFFSPALAREILATHGPASIIIANNMIANVADMTAFGAGIAELLAPDGAFVFETQYGADVIERNLLDTVYHEHISYFFIEPTEQYLNGLGLRLFDVQRIDTKGGSFRATAVRRENSRQPTSRVAGLLAEEHEKGCRSDGYYEQLRRAVGDLRAAVQSTVATDKARGMQIGGYGVSVGTTTLLPQLGLTNEIQFLVDDDPQKPPSLRGPGYDIPVIRQSALQDRAPATVVVFAWRYADAIVAKNREFLESGGRFVIPLPSLRIVDLETAKAFGGGP